MLGPECSKSLCKKPTTASTFPAHGTLVHPHQSYFLGWMPPMLFARIAPCPCRKPNSDIQVLIDVKVLQSSRKDPQFRASGLRGPDGSEPYLLLCPDTEQSCRRSLA